jgi:hypothetical protein
MALTLQLADSDGNLLPESYAILDEELLEYLSGFSSFPALRSFGELPQEEKTPIGQGAREAMAREAVEMAPLVQRRQVPEPPAWVGLQGTGDIRLGEEFGWEGLLAFLLRLEHLVHLARTMGLDLLALPND